MRFQLKKKGFFGLNYTVVVGVIVIVLVAGFVIVFNPFKPIQDISPESKEFVEESNFFFDREPNPLPDYNNLSECTALEGNQKSNCITDVAIQQQNGALCGLLSTDLVAWCKKDVIVASGNENECSALPEAQRNQCHFDFGYNNNLVISCQQISLQYWVDDCLAFVAQHTLKLSTCSLIADADVKDGCVFNIAMNTNNILLCNQIMDAESRANCRLSFEPYYLPGDEPA